MSKGKFIESFPTILKVPRKTLCQGDCQAFKVFKNILDQPLPTTRLLHKVDVSINNTSSRLVDLEGSYRIKLCALVKKWL